MGDTRDARFYTLVLKFIETGQLGECNIRNGTIILYDLINEPNCRAKIRDIVASVCGSYLIAPVNSNITTDIKIQVY